MSDRSRALFGLTLLLVIFILAMAIAIGHVEEKTSYGLQLILGCLTTLSGSFANWAFGHRDDTSNKS